jgi:hypothetical protein
MLNFPFQIPGYGIIQDEEALKLFNKHYEWIVERSRLLNNDNQRLYNQIPNDILIVINTGNLQEVFATYPGNVIVTLVDIDNLEVQEQDSDESPFVATVTQGNMEVTQMIEDLKYYVNNALVDNFDNYKYYPIEYK